MKNKLRKQYQRKFNKVVRKVNSGLANDSLWKGRFVFRQTDASFEEFEDHSGGILYVRIRGYDKSTGFYKDFLLDYAPYLPDYHLWKIANDFIVEDTGVWSEDPRPSEKTMKDFTPIKAPEEVWHKPYNYHQSYEYWKKGSV